MCVGLMTVLQRLPGMEVPLSDPARDFYLTERETESQRGPRSGCGRMKLEFMLILLKPGQEHFWRLEVSRVTKNQGLNMVQPK